MPSSRLWIGLAFLALSACGSVSSHPADAAGDAVSGADARGDGGGGGADGPGTPDGATDANPYAVCEDFEDGDALGWRPIGGTWAVVSGAYQGRGDTTPYDCANRYHSLIESVTATDVALDITVTAVAGVDKFLILREDASGNRLEVNFRSDRLPSFPADILIQECVDGVPTLHSPEFSLLNPTDAPNVPLPVSVELVETHLRINVGGTFVVDQEFPLVVRSGAVGLGVLNDQVTTFDDVKLRILTP